MCVKYTIDMCWMKISSLFVDSLWEAMLIFSEEPWAVKALMRWIPSLR